MAGVKRFVDFWFKNRHTGQLTFWQWPNPPLWGFMVFAAIRAVTDGGLHTVASVLATLSLLVWALFEVTTGVNPFRRLMGVLVLVGMALSAR